MGESPKRWGCQFVRSLSAEWHLGEKAPATRRDPHRAETRWCVLAEIPLCYSAQTEKARHKSRHMLLSLREEPGVQQAGHQATSSAPPSQQSALQPPTMRGGSRGDVSELSPNAARLYPGQLVSLPGKAGSDYKKHRQDAGSILEQRGRGRGGPAL